MTATIPDSVLLLVTISSLNLESQYSLPVHLLKPLTQVKDICASAFTAELRSSQNLGCPNRCRIRVCGTDFLAVYKDKILPFAAAWTDGEY